MEHNRFCNTVAGAPENRWPIINNDNNSSACTLCVCVQYTYTCTCTRSQPKGDPRPIVITVARAPEFDLLPSIRIPAWHTRLIYAQTRIRVKKRVHLIRSHVSSPVTGYATRIVSMLSRYWFPNPKLYELRYLLRTCQRSRIAVLDVVTRFFIFFLRQQCTHIQMYTKIRSLYALTRIPL
jgi:hypothetical protein